MSILQQIIELLSRPPGSAVYHLLTLFALQIVLALAYVRWQRDPNDEGARRMTFAAGGIFIARLLLLIVALAVEADPVRARVLLPPLEQAIDLATVILLVWGLTPFAPDRPRLADGVLLGSLVVTSVVFLFFYQDWQNRVGTGTTYISTVQAYIWGVLQMGVLGVGLVRLALDRQARFSLRPIIIAVVLLAHVAHFFNYPEIIPSGSEVAYWLRLGYLVAFPLWAVVVYRDSMRNLLTIAEADRSAAGELMRTLRLSAGVIGARAPQLRLEQALEMATGLVPTQFATIGLIDEQNPQRIVFSHSRPSISREWSYGRQIGLSDHPAFRLAYEQQRGIELLPRGIGARQVHELSQQFNAGALGPVFVEPLIVANKCIGFLLLGAPSTLENWTDRDRAVVPGLASFLARAIANSQQVDSERSFQQPAPIPVSLNPPVERDTDKDRLIVELGETRRQLAEMESRARQAEAVAVYLQQRDRGQATVARPQVAQAAAGPALDSALTCMLPYVRQKSLKVDVTMQPDLPLVAVKEKVLNQLMLSLLENACRASADDTAVTVRAEPFSSNGNGSARLITFTFTDGGAGIRPEDRENVFNSQYFLQDGRPIRGLGDHSPNLAVVQRLAQAIGGDLFLENGDGEGSTFTLRLPAAEVQPWTMLKPTPAADGKLAPVAEAGELSSEPVEEALADDHGA